MKNKNIIRIALTTLGILLIPLALQLTIGTGVDGQGWNWTLGDFVFAAIFIFVAGLVLDAIWRKFDKHRTITIAAAVLLFLYLWAELAVGIFTNLGS